MASPEGGIRFTLWWLKEVYGGLRMFAYEQEEATESGSVSQRSSSSCHCRRDAGREGNGSQLSPRSLPGIQGGWGSPLGLLPPDWGWEMEALLQLLEMLARG